MNELQTRVVKGDKCVECCERAVRQLNVELGALMSGLLAALDRSNGTNAVALVPVALASAATRGFASVVTIEGAAATAGGAAVLGPLLTGAVLIGTAAEMVNLASQRASYDMLGLVMGAISTYFAIRDSPDTETEPQLGAVGPKVKTKTKTRKSCEDCVRKRILSQAARRHREVKKILARV